MSMFQRYTIDEILKLRASPLVCKPEHLPPVEEWMGAPVDANQRKASARGRQEDNLGQAEISLKRPGVADAHHLARRSSTAPEDIVLGPPKIAFASANARYSTKNINQDITEEPQSGSKDRFSFHERFAKEKESGERETERREGRHNGVNGKRLGRDEREDWQSGRPRRNHDQDETEARSRRNGDRERDRPRWDTKENNDQQDSNKGGREEGKPPPRRDGQGRARFEQPWFRGEKSLEATDDLGKTEAKQQEWRRDRGSGRGAERDWERSRKGEQDPEWMDSTPIEEPKQAHTQEDFQRWKEKMKAGNNATNEEQEPSSSQRKGEPLEVEMTKSEMPALVDKPNIDVGMDQFFDFFKDKSGGTDSKSMENKAPRKPRFAALFSPPAQDPIKEMASVPDVIDQPASTPVVTQPAAAISSDADQEGFQRILQMLGGRSSNSTPQSQGPPKARTPLYSREEKHKLLDQPQSPVTDTFHKQEPPLTAEILSRHRNSAALDSLLGARASAHQAETQNHSGQSKDTDFLLRLMQESNITPIQPSQLQSGRNQAQSLTHTPGILQMPGSLGRPQIQQKPKGTPLSFFDEPKEANVHRPEQRMPRESARRPANGPTTGLFDEPFFTDLRQANQQASVTNLQIRTGLPPGIQRPPGLDQTPLTGWSGHQQFQQQHQHQHQQMQMSAPPGIPNPPHRSMNPPFPPGPPMGHNMGMPSFHHVPQIQRQRKHTGDTGPNFPPGMGPPPGFMNTTPAAFSGMPHGMSGPGRQYEGNSGILPAHLMDVFAGGERTGGRGGGVGMPGGYR